MQVLSRHVCYLVKLAFQVKLDKISYEISMHEWIIAQQTDDQVCIESSSRRIYTI